jgi:hypothetical protein
MTDTRKGDLMPALRAAPRGADCYDVPAASIAATDPRE